MNPSCTQERKFIKLNRLPINVNPKQEMQKSAKLRNNPTSFPHIVMQIMKGTSLTDARSPHQFTSSMVPSLTGVPRNSMKTTEAVQIHKQKQCTQGCYIKTGPETYLDQLVIP